jgi:predicted dehydrogenase
MGCGEVADFGHIPAILQTPGLELAAVYDPSPNRLQLIGDKYGIANRFGDLERFFDCKLDAVIVASPAPTHLENGIAAARHACHVLCEKPLEADEARSLRLAQEVSSEGKALFTAFCYRFSPVAQQIRSWVRDGIVGEIRALRLIYDWNLHGRYEPTANGEWIESPRWRGRMIEGGPLVDCGVHQIDLARWWLGSEITSVEAAGAWVSDYEAPDHIYCHLRHANGALTTVETSFTFGHTARDPWSIFSYHLIGTGGLLRYERDGYLVEAHTWSETIRVPGASEKNFPGMWGAFAHWLETGEKGDLATPEDGIIATKLATRATEAAIAQRNQ